MYTKLGVWKDAISLVTNIYKLTENFPKSEIYGLASQIRRAAVSIPSNIAEGSARKSNKEYSQFLSISLGSIAELDTQLIIAKNLAYLEEAGCIDYSLQLASLRNRILGLKRVIDSNT